ncbi:MAG: hypothetical protein WAX57_02335 [Minisyncoccia bacterium]
MKLLSLVLAFTFISILAGSAEAGYCDPISLKDRVSIGPFCSEVGRRNPSRHHGGQNYGRRHGDIRINMNMRRQTHRQPVQRGPIVIQAPRPEGGYRCEMNGRTGWCVD